MDKEIMEREIIESGDRSSYQASYGHCMGVRQALDRR